MPDRERRRPSGAPGLRIAALVLGAFAVFWMTAAAMSDWVYDEDKLPPQGESAFVIGTVAWLAALAITVARRAPRAATALAATPVLLAVLWAVYWQG